MPLSAAEHEKKCLVLHPKLHPLYKETMRCLFTGQALARAPTCPQGLKNLSIPEKHYFHLIFWKTVFLLQSKEG
jgi:hypothetical protein